MAAHSVDDPERIRLLGSPVRQDIVDYVDAAGPSTVAEIAAALGRPADTLYYHVGLLREAGLLVVREATAGRAVRVVDLPGAGLQVRYRPEDPENVAAVRDAVGTMLRSAERRFAAGLEGRAGTVAVEGPRRSLWASRVRGRLTEAELEEVNGLIRRLHEVFAGGRGRGPEEGRMHEVNVVLSPLAEAVAARDSA